MFRNLLVFCGPGAYKNAAAIVASGVIGGVGVAASPYLIPFFLYGLYVSISKAEAIPLGHDEAITIYGLWQGKLKNPGGKFTTGEGYSMVSEYCKKNNLAVITEDNYNKALDQLARIRSLTIDSDIINLTERVEIREP